MLTTTFARLEEKGACTDGYKKLAKSLGGVRKYGKDTPIPLDKIMESNGLDDTFWTLQATIEPSENISIEISCLYAEHVLMNFESLYPNNTIPRDAIAAARRCIVDKSSDAKSAAWCAAESAYYAANYAAKSDAEYAAMYAAESAYYAARSAAWSARSAASARYAAWSAGSAAWSARYAASAEYAASAGYAAGYAAGSAERDWQTQTLLQLLRK